MIEVANRNCTITSVRHTIGEYNRPDEKWFCGSRSNAGGFHGEAAAEADQCSRGFIGGAGGRHSLQDRGCCRRQRGILGGRRPQRRGNGSRLAARPARRRSYKNGHESGEREGSGISYASFALLQVRRVIFWCGGSAEGAYSHATLETAVCQRCSTGSKPSERYNRMM